MSLPITLLFASIFTLFALLLSARAGSYRGKAGVSILYGEPQNHELVERVRVHQNFLEYVPMLLIMMALIEANGGSATFLYSIGALLFVSRLAHAVGLKQDNMAHKGRFIGAAGTALITLSTVAYGFWIGIGRMLADN